MRIAVVHSYYSSRQPSGENSVVDDQVEALREAGHDVRLVARRTDDLEKAKLYGGRAALRVMTGNGWSPSDELSEYEPDVVHLHNTFPNIGTGWLAQWGTRTVVTLHNFRTVCAAGTLFRDGLECTDCLTTPALPAIRHACYRGSRAATVPLAVATRPRGPLRRIGIDAAEVIALNEVAQETLSRVFDRPVQVLPNFTAEQDVQAGPRERWLYVGRLAPEKGIRELISAWPLEEQLDIVGSGPLEREIQELASSRPSIRHLGLLDREALLGRMGGYEGLMLPSLWPEGLPTVVLEALSSGLPVVVSDRVAASDELVRAGVATHLETPLNEGSVRSALARHRSVESLHEHAQVVHSERYSRDAWLRQILPIYERVASG